MLSASSLDFPLGHHPKVAAHIMVKFPKTFHMTMSGAQEMRQLLMLAHI
jgi:hypothetical protein